jgi:4-aminobutyrate aminotransferase/(S)-3-amino-2-methylpropionate transaminase
MVAVELVEEGDPAKPAAGLTKDLVQAAAASGLIILACGVRGNVIRFLAPLTTPLALIDEGMDVLEACLKRLQNAS